MSEPKKRKLNTTGARRAYDQDQDLPRSAAHSAAPAAYDYEKDTGGTRTVRRTAQTRTGSGGMQQTVFTVPAGGSPSGGAPRRPAPKKRKKKRSFLATFLLLLLALVGLGVAALCATFYVVTDGMQGNVTISEFINTPKEYKGDVVNVLVCGIDYEEGRAYSNDPESNDGMTDMIMYVNFDVANKKINIMQIPRNTFVGDKWPNTNGQINSVALAGKSIDTLAQLIADQFKLPVDYYVTIDMQSLKEIVDTFGGVRVYVPRDMSYGGSQLQQGYQTLDGNAAEFFVRNRHGDGYANSDLDRLTMQRYFYSGLLRQFRTMTVWDVAKMLPVFRNYVRTDVPVSTMVSLGVSLLQVDSANIMLCRTPEYGSTEFYNGNSVINAAPQETADLLNQYFRTYTGPVSAEQMNLASWYPSSSFYDANISFMGALDTETEDAVVNNNIDGSRDDVALNPPKAEEPAEGEAAPAA